MRVATREQQELAIRKYGFQGAADALRQRGLEPRMSGAAGWSNSQVNSTSITGAGSTGVSLAFGSNVTAGQLIVVADTLLASGRTAAITDSSANVSSWTQVLGSYPPSSPSFSSVIAWGVATATAACTPKVTWNSPASSTFEHWIGSFNTPGGTVTQDGMTLEDSSSGPHGNQSTIQWPLGGGSQANDLVISLVNGIAFQSLGGSWTAMGTAENGDIASYLLNVAGSPAPSVTQTSSAAWWSMTVALGIQNAGNVLVIAGPGIISVGHP